MSDFFPDLPADRTPVAPRTADGMRGIVFPVTGLEEIPVLVKGHERLGSGCADPVLAFGVRPPVDEGPNDRIPALEHLTAEFRAEHFAALYAAAFAQHGILFGTLFNSGPAGNVSEQQRYTVEAVVGNRLTLTGPNPKFQVFAQSELNPGWEVGVSGRIQYTNKYFSLSPGAMVVFDAGSVLYNKLRPMVTKVYPPESDAATATFDVEVWASCENAVTPFDAGVVPSNYVYHVDIYWNALTPQPWPNYQPIQWEWWTSRSLEWVVEEGEVELGVVEFVNSEDVPSRIIYPNMPFPVIPGFLGFALSYIKGDESAVVVSGTEALELLSTVWDSEAGRYVSRLDLTGLGAVEVNARAWVQAIDEDTGRVPWLGSCSNSQVDFSGSYVHDEATGRRCTNVACPAFSSFRGECWNPDVPDFALGNNRRSWGGKLVLPPYAWGDSEAVSRAWSDTSLILKQGEVGGSSHRNFSYSMVGIHSLQEMCGSFRNLVFGGLFSRYDQVYPPQFGEVYTADDDRSYIRHGFFIRDKEVNLASTYRPTGAVGNIDGWLDQPGDDGNARERHVRAFLNGNQGGASVATYRHQGNAMIYRVRYDGVVRERYCLGFVRDCEDDEELANTVRSWF